MGGSAEWGKGHPRQVATKEASGPELMSNHAETLRWAESADFALPEPGALLEPSLRDAASLRVRLGSKLTAFQAAQWEKLQSWKKHFITTGEQQRWVESMPEAVRYVCNSLQGPLLGAALAACRHDDCTLLADLHDGFEAVGKITVSGTWAPRIEADAAPLADILATARTRQDAGHVRMPTRNQQELWSAVKEQARRKRFELVRAGSVEALLRKIRAQLGDFVDQLYFGVEQGDKVRGCQGAKQAGITAATQLQEKMHMMGIDGVAGLVRSAAKVHPTEQLTLSKVDWKKMFHQAGMRPQHRKFFVSLVIDTDSNEIVAAIPRCMTFGGRAQPQQCSRMPRAVVVIARRFFGLLCDHHVDDVVQCAPATTAPAEFHLLGNIHRLLGFEIAGPAGPADKYFGPCSQGLVLGAGFHLPPPPCGAGGTLILWEVPEGKADKYADGLLRARARCSPGTASKLAGQLTWAFSLSWGRVGGIFLRSLYDQAHAESAQTDRRFRMSVDGLVDLLRSSGADGLRHAVLREPCSRPHCVLIGDARGRGRPYGTEAIGAIIADTRLQRWEFFSAAVDDSLEKFLPKNRLQRINEAETLWVWVALRTWGHYLAGADITVLVDSSAASGVIRKGMSGSPTLCCLSAEVWRMVRLLGARIWVIRIPSAANPADPLSRLEISAAVRLGWSRVNQPQIPSHWTFDPAKWGL